MHFVTGIQEWSSTVCFNFLDQLLTEIKKAVNGDESSVYVIEYKPERKVSVPTTFAIRIN